MHSKFKIILTIVVLITACPLLGALAAPDAFSIQVVQTFDYPGAVSTQPQKVNENRDIVGVFTDSSGLQHGFIRFSDGSFSPPITDPNDTGGVTQGRGINNSKLVCGDYLDASTGNYHGFFLRGGTFIPYDVAGSSWTIVLGLNNARDFCGSDISGTSGAQVGFVSIGGAVTEFSVPTSTNTLAYQINSSNQACGYYINSSGITHGYYRNSDGSIFGPIDPAGSTGTIVFGNNDANWIVGRFPDASGATHGFLFIPPSRYVTFDYPGSTFTSLNGINDQNVIVGRYDDSSGFEHGIIARVVRGSSSQPQAIGSVPQNVRQSGQTLPLRAQPAEPAF